MLNFCGIEELNVLSYFFLQDFYPCLSVKFVTDGHTVERKWFTGCGDLASWIFFMEVSILITSGWVLVAMITTCHYKLMKGKALRKQSLHEKTAASSFTMLRGTGYVYGQTLWDGT